MTCFDLKSAVDMLAWDFQAQTLRGLAVSAFAFTLRIQTPHREAQAILLEKEAAFFFFLLTTFFLIEV